MTASIDPVVLLGLALSFGLGALLSWTVMRLSLGPWRRAAGLHWAERARILWPMRGNLFCAILASSLLAVVVAAFLGESGLGCVAGAAVGGLLGTYPGTKELEPRQTFGRWLIETSLALLLVLGPTLIVLALAFTMPRPMDAAAWWRTGIGFALAAFLRSLLWLPWLLRCSGGALESERELPRLERIAERVSREGATRIRTLWVLKSQVANAVAFPLWGGIAFTTRAMEILDDGEAEAIMAHEIAHLREAPWVALVRVVAPLRLFLFAFILPAIDAWGAAGLLVLLLLFVLAGSLSARLFRRMETGADASACRREGVSAVYAEALRKLHEANRLPAVMPTRSGVHPHLYDRMLEAGVEPDFPRPSPPRRYTWPGAASLAIAVVVLLLVAALSFLPGATR